MMKGDIEGNEMKIINKFCIGAMIISFNVYSGIENPYTGEYVETRDVLMEIEIPDNIDRELLTVETTEINGKQLSDIDGNVFKLKVPLNNDLLAMMYYETEDDLYVLGYAPIFDDQNSVIINPINTAIGMMWYAVGFDYDKPKAKEILERASKREEIIALGNDIYKNLSNDMGYLMGLEIFQTDVYKNALKAFVEEIRKEPEWLYLRREMISSGLEKEIRLN